MINKFSPLTITSIFNMKSEGKKIENILARWLEVWAHEIEELLFVAEVVIPDKVIMETRRIPIFFVIVFVLELGPYQRRTKLIFCDRPPFSLFEDLLYQSCIVSSADISF